MKANGPVVEGSDDSVEVGAPQQSSHMDLDPLPDELAIPAGDGLPDGPLTDGPLPCAPPVELQGSVQLETTAAPPAISRAEAVGAASHQPGGGGASSQTESWADSKHLMRSTVRVNVAVWSHLQSEGQATAIAKPVRVFDRYPEKSLRSLQLEHSKVQ